MNWKGAEARKKWWRWGVNCTRSSSKKIWFHRCDFSRWASSIFTFSLSLSLTTTMRLSHYTHSLSDDDKGKKKWKFANEIRVVNKFFCCCHHLSILWREMKKNFPSSFFYSFSLDRILKKFFIFPHCHWLCNCIFFCRLDFSLIFLHIQPTTISLSSSHFVLAHFLTRC